ncbi:unnamed protein product [Rotaria magnacalcarata]|uniref:Uncharacterized protein n=1 Tax=Rotaria magnacalcarata TaxID=392030 RepID=A0A816YQ64_9BILA|nr:unnamed protein product [Rotaria magnacalcarata]
MLHRQCVDTIVDANIRRTEIIGHITTTQKKNWERNIGSYRVHISLNVKKAAERENKILLSLCLLLSSYLVVYKGRKWTKDELLEHSTYEEKEEEDDDEEEEEEEKKQLLRKKKTETHITDVIDVRESDIYVDQ